MKPSEVRGPWDGCWEWTGSTNDWGYGHARIGGADVLVHRAVYEAIYGSLPEQVMHRCDNPPCFRPDHLLAGDQAANMADMVGKRRHRRHSIDVCPAGHPLTGDNVRGGSHGERICRTCSATHSRESASRQVERLGVRHCALCSAPFMSKNPDARFCSRTCGSRSRFEVAS